MYIIVLTKPNYRVSRGWLILVLFYRPRLNRQSETMFCDFILKNNLKNSKT